MIAGAGDDSIPESILTSLKKTLPFLKTANIAKLVLSSSEPQRAIAINQLSFVTVTTDIPEPIYTKSLLSLGLLGFGVKSKKKCQS
ncbi:hypothetical protein M595_3097 [Lyngbya aestuarii BL J]|uniref:Uncharacterized protein n=2 Tax=Lyngbya aestuarii TaxID=118322 RepID=U7QGB9_9CYAN|nr:hypothetical protein M595_3097 [Lyngbya aestuarii BL J]